MTRYRTKPFEIEAVQFNRDGDHPAVIARSSDAGSSEASLQVKGHQGWSSVNRGDWIIAEPDGKGFYPCDPDTFACKYEPVE